MFPHSYFPNGHFIGTYWPPVLHPRGGGGPACWWEGSCDEDRERLLRQCRIEIGLLEPETSPDEVEIDSEFQKRVFKELLDDSLPTSFYDLDRRIFEELRRRAIEDEDAEILLLLMD